MIFEKKWPDVAPLPFTAIVPIVLTLCYLIGAVGPQGVTGPGLKNLK